MNSLNTQCPTDAVLSDFGLGKLDAGNCETIARHLETCPDCQRRVAGISGDSFVGRLRQADADKPAPRRERTYVPGESLANAANSTDGSLEDGLPRPSRNTADRGKRDGLGSPSSVSAPPELAKHPDYELIKQLGQGGMGTVYLAKNRMMDRLEVLKVISKSLLGQPGAMERFQQEIRAAAKLSHPNVVAAYRVQRAGDLLVFAMEYVAGRDLQQVVKARGYLPVTNAALYGHQVALGLEHAFEKGMIHRDIKPNNLMLVVEGKKHVVKILDFGLARASSENDALTGLTKSGQMLGTPDFVAPEQILDARKADIRADIYSLGCTLYYLLSGQAPFKAASLYEVLEAHHKHEATTLNLVRADVPVELAAVVAKMMAKDPARRYQTPGEVAKALVPFFKPAQAVAAPPRTDATQSPSTGDTAHGLGGAMPISPAMPPPFPIPHAQPATAVAQPTMVAVEPAPPTTIQPTKPARSTTHHRPPWIAQAAGAGFLALLLGVIVIIRNQQGNVVARVESQEGTTVEVKKFETEPAGADAPPDNAKPDSPAGVPSSNPPPLAVAPFDAKQARAHQDAWAEHLGVPVEQTNSIGMKLVLIPPGEFMMGSPKTEIDRLVHAYNDAQFQRHFRSEGPQHSVKLTAPFCLSTCEVTQQQYEELMGVNRSHFFTRGAAKGALQGQDTSRHPVEMVSWFDAIEFCNKLSEREEMVPRYVRDGESVQLREGTGYRLPEEAEWEYACRAGTTTPWYSGNDWQNLGKAAWFRRNSGLRTHPVGELAGNPFGLFDQYGNVWEWCWDRHGEYAAEAGSDPTNLPAGAQRVQRGGAWNDAYNWARSAFRGWGDPNSRGGNVGFRVARTIYSRVAKRGASP